MYIASISYAIGNIHHQYYATRLIENGVDIRIVRILVGHARIASTAIYTQLTTPTRTSLHSLLDQSMTGL
jgi:integrase/recombinase XerD